MELGRLINWKLLPPCSNLIRGSLVGTAVNSVMIRGREHETGVGWMQPLYIEGFN